MSKQQFYALKKVSQIFGQDINFTKEKLIGSGQFGDIFLVSNCKNKYALKTLFSFGGFYIISHIWWYVRNQYSDNVLLFIMHDIF